MSNPSTRFRVTISESRCRSCAVCWEVCKPTVLAGKPPLNKAIVVDADACTGCRLCEWLCPDWAVTVHALDTQPAEVVS